MCVLLITLLLRLVGRWARKPVNHTSLVALVTPTDRPKSVRNRCLIELFCGVVCVVTCPFDISVGIGAFVIGLGQMSSFLSLQGNNNKYQIFSFVTYYMYFLNNISILQYFHIFGCSLISFITIFSFSALL